MLKRSAENIMPITISYAEQATGIVLNAAGERELDASKPYAETVTNLPKAITALENYFETTPESEALLMFRGSSWRVSVPDRRAFKSWISHYAETGETGGIELGLDVGAVITAIGLPAKVAAGAGIGGILRYSPGSVDFHFLEDGTLFLVHDDDLDNPKTILRL